MNKLNTLFYNCDFKVTLSRNMLELKTLTRPPNDLMRSYICLNVHNIMVYDNETDGFFSLAQLTGNHNLHITISYSYCFGSYQNAHLKAYKARSFIGGLQGDEIWASTRLFFGEGHIGLKVLPSCDLFGVLKGLSNIFEETYENFHVTIWNC